MAQGYVSQKAGLIDVTKPGFWLVKVDPEQAMEWLTKNYQDNRKKVRSNVEYLAEQMGNGQWRDDHPDPIIFNTKGELINGQHRLEAILLSMCSVSLRMETGADPSLYEHLDSNKVRRLEDRIKFHEKSHLNVVIVRLINAMQRREIGRARTTPKAAHEVFEAHKNGLLWIAGHYRTIKGISKTPVLLAAVEYYERDPVKAEAFVMTLLEPNGEGTVQQARVLRDNLLRRLGMPSDDLDLYMLSVAAMRSHRDDREIKLLRGATWGDK